MLFRQSARKLGTVILFCISWKLENVTIEKEASFAERFRNWGLQLETYVWELHLYSSMINFSLFILDAVSCLIQGCQTYDPGSHATWSVGYWKGQEFRGRVCCWNWGSGAPLRTHQHSRWVIAALMLTASWYYLPCHWVQIWPPGAPHLGARWVWHSWFLYHTAMASDINFQFWAMCLV